MNSILQSIRNFFSDYRKTRILLAGIVFVALIGLVISGYLIYQDRKEKTVSLRVNEIVKKKNKIFEQMDEEEISAEDFTNQLVELGAELNQIYLENPNTQNGERGLLTSAQIDLFLGSSEVIEKLQKIVAAGNELTPLALFLISREYENREDYDQALEVLKDFDGKYILHYLKPLVMLNQARLHRLLDQADQAAAIYTQILQNQEYSLFYERAEEGIDLLEWERREKGLEGKDGFVPEYDASMTPDYLQNSN